MSEDLKILIQILKHALKGLFHEPKHLSSKGVQHTILAQFSFDKCLVITNFKTTEMKKTI